MQSAMLFEFEEESLAEPLQVLAGDSPL
jgi:hypothetical protein